MSQLKKTSVNQSLEKHSFFAQEDHGVIDKLVAELQTRIYNDKDTIIKKGDVGRAMFIVVKGEVQVVSDDGETILNTLKEGSFFGEIGVLFSVPRTATVRSRGRSIILTLTKQKLEQVLEEYPETAQRITVIAKERFETYMKQQAKSKQVAFGEELGLSITHKDLQNVPVFRDCAVGFLHMLAMQLEPVEFYENQFIFRKGEMGKEMFFVVKGCAIAVNDHDFSELVEFNPGSFFGEVALFFDVPRTVSVKVKTPTCNVFKLSMEYLKEALAKYPEVVKKITTEAKIRYQYNQMRKDANLETRVEEETDAEVIRERLKTISFFRDLPISFLHRLSLMLTINKYKSSELILKKNDPGNSMHFLVHGQAKVLTYHASEENIVALLASPTFFGEVALFYDTPRTATVAADTECVTFELSREALSSLLEEHPELKETFYERAKENYKKFLERKQGIDSRQEALDVQIIVQRLDKVPLFQGCRADFLHDLALNCRFATFEKNQIVVRKGDTASAMFIVIRGFVQVFDEESDQIYATVPAGHFFGEIGVLHAIKRTASVRVTSEDADLIVLTAEAINSVSREHPDTYKLISLEADRRLIIAKTREKEYLNELKKKRDDVKRRAGVISHSPSQMHHNTMSHPMGHATLFNGNVSKEVELGKHTGSMQTHYPPSEVMARQNSVDSTNPKYQSKHQSVFLNKDSVTGTPFPGTSVTVSRVQSQAYDDGQGMMRQLSTSSLLESSFQSEYEDHTKQEESKKQTNPIKQLFKVINQKLKTKIHPVNSVHSMDHLNPKQLLHKSQQLSFEKLSLSRTRLDFSIIDLNDDLLIKIFAYLTLSEKFRYRTVCKSWNSLLTEKKAWKTVAFGTSAARINNQMVVLFCRMLGEYLINLDLSNCWQLVDDNLVTIAANCIGVTRLNISNCWKISDDGVNALKLMDRLKHLDISFIQKIASKTVEEHKWYSLEHFNMSFCKQIGHSSLEKFMQKTPNITNLSLKRCNKMADFGIFCIAKYLRNLKVLDLSDCDQINDSCVKWIGTGCSQLTDLNLTFCCKLTGSGIQDLCSRAKRLQNLNLSFCFLLDNRVGYSLQNLVELEILSLRGCRRLNSSFFSGFHGMRSLKMLDLTQCPFMLADDICSIQYWNSDNCEIYVGLQS